MSEPLDLIVVQYRADREVPADRADLLVDIRGDALFSGAEALKKAREVRALVDGLRGLGLQDDCVSVEDIQAFTDKGLFSRSSSALYGLRVRCRDLELLADILELTTGLKAATLTRLEWGYDEGLRRAQTELLQECAVQAREKAEAAAEAAGVQLGPLHRLTEAGAREPVQHHVTELNAYSVARRKSRSLKDELGFSIVHKHRVEVRVTAEYCISPAG